MHSFLVRYHHKLAFFFFFYNISFFIGRDKIKCPKLKVENKMDGDRATFSCEFNSLLRHPDDVQFSSEPELQITSDTGLVWYKRNHYRTAHICHPRLLMGFEFREVGNSGKKLQSDHYLNKYS